MISVVVISKDEPSLDDTLTTVVGQGEALGEPFEVIVVDASEGRLEQVELNHRAHVKWIQFEPPNGVHISIPHQRNAGVLASRGDIIVFTDAGCLPEAGWLSRLVEPLFGDEHVTFGLTLGIPGGIRLHDRLAMQKLESPYLTECSTINLAFRRQAFEAVGGFDARFAYGSDVDFSWRLIDAGYRIRSVPDAVVRHDWGTSRRQARRSYLYGRARTRLYRKHPARLRHLFKNDPMVIIYPVFLLGLPLTFVFPLYPALLIIPAWRNRADGAIRVVIDHLIFGAGVLAEIFDR
jgi:glycosyltransferase involved in cell wall biosynthesis